MSQLATVLGALRRSWRLSAREKGERHSSWARSLSNHSKWFWAKRWKMWASLVSTSLTGPWSLLLEEAVRSATSLFSSSAFYRCSNTLSPQNPQRLCDVDPVSDLWFGRKQLFSRLKYHFFPMDHVGGSRLAGFSALCQYDAPHMSPKKRIMQENGNSP